MSFIMKSLVIIVFFASSVASQKCKKPKGKVGDSYPDDMSPCHEFVCTAVSKKAAAWIKFPALGQCCVHNGTLYEVGSNIENNSEECEKVILSCQMDEQTSVPSVVYQVDTDNCGSDVLDYIRDTVQMNNDKLDALLACNACNESTTPKELAILITGGRGANPKLSSVEVLHANGSQWCSLPDLPMHRDSHTQAGRRLCGGSQYDSDPSTGLWSNCLTFTDGDWVASHTMEASSYRAGHCSWDSPDGLVLLGGWNTVSTSEILSFDTGDSMEYFPLKYPITDACSIEMGDHVVVTGGRYGSVPFESVRAEVSVYNGQGWVEDYAGLNTGRQQHGCGHYVNGDNNVVYLVTGGYSTATYTTSSNAPYLADTELLIHGDPSWASAGPLPVSRRYLRVVSINNGILATGGWHWTGPTSTGCSSCSFFYNDVLKFDPSTLQWTNVGAMSVARHGHGVSVVKAEDVEEYCN